jgi:hypothetical protein
MLNILKFFLCLLVLSCETIPVPEPYVPFKTFHTQPPGELKNWKQPIQLECIDNSNIYVYTNGDWWYSGPRDMSTKGWVPTSGGWYPLPYQVWPEKVTWLSQPWQQ